ncbi:hypothetical protein HYC85_028363 [Camellia sinensis]|uniref:Uncharacterized protein n=1 Tax=Camellia sinensis TaxID=4442 RepID=A0A7J7FV49_CAMSI|nr:hypothetical protein HYC85_028363 [Camellia sinensis]
MEIGNDDAIGGVVCDGSGGVVCDGNGGVVCDGNGGDCYDPLDPNGNVTATFNILQWTVDGYVVLPRWVVYHELVLTTNEYMRQVGDPLEKAALKGIEWSYKSDEKAMPKKYVYAILGIRTEMQTNWILVEPLFFSFSPEFQDILPGIINQLGPDNLDNLRKLAKQFQKQAPGAGAGASATAAQEDDDDQVPDLVAGETFEAAAEERNLILLRPRGS